MPDKSMHFKSESCIGGKHSKVRLTGMAAASAVGEKLAHKRKVALVFDKCPAHPEVENLKAIKLVFLPPNTTSKTQPTDQGVIRSLKAKYRTVLVQKYIREIDQQKSLPKISILDAMDILAASWSMVSETTIVNCFAKAGLSSKNQHQAASDEDDPFKDLVEELTKL
ncbi:tigger transposable element-derived protein 4-like [Rhopilema esculentum]|uniref:tigger transposable element-derived protein 4-like n=1 Tax=Rhopilema esculentum TaxID=499914 RepID=UPI0031DD399E